MADDEKIEIERATHLVEVIDTPRLLKRVANLEAQLTAAKQETNALRKFLKHNGYPPEPWAYDDQIGTIITQLPYIDMGESLKNYKGYLICESMTPPVARLIVRAPQMARLLCDVANCVYDALPHATIGEIRELVSVLPQPMSLGGDAKEPHEVQHQENQSNGLEHF